MSPPLRATIDIGTNSCLLLVARADGQVLERVEDRATITRLGEGVDRTRRLSPEAIARTLQCLRAYVARVRDLGAGSLRVVATSAVRDAVNHEDFLRPAQQVLGVAVETITGQREALLSFRGALPGLALAEGTRVLMLDVGGGSTEIIAGRVGDEPDLASSLDVGSVRLTERLIRHDPPRPEERAAVTAALQSALRVCGPAPAHECLVGIAGTVTSLAAMCRRVVPYDGARIHGAVLSRDEVREVSASLAGEALAQRRQRPGLDPRRADVIIAGSWIVLAVMEWAGATSLHVSDGGVRVGLLLD